MLLNRWVLVLVIMFVLRVQLDAVLAEDGSKIWMVLQIEVANKEVLKDRLCGRWVHPVSRRSYHVHHNPPRSFVQAASGGHGVMPSAENMLDDDDGTSLIQRADNTADAVERALSEYDLTTTEVVAYYQRQCDYDVMAKTSDSLEDLLASPRSAVRQQVAQAHARRLLVQVDGEGDLVAVSARVWNQIH
jgi:adenylate kinase family enzyme